MVWLIRTLIGFAVFVVAVVFAATWLPAWLNRVQVPVDYDDLQGLEGGKGLWLEPPPYRAGDVLAYRLGPGPDDVGFGVVVALPGDSVRLSEGRLLVNGEAVRPWSPYQPLRGLAELGPLTVPAGHWFVVSTRHQRDSLAHGPIGAERVLGKVRE
ncbi:MAG: S26 family signal peptidase [Planctomycetota bacterium]|nr:S26 family signal peptidase [Planctomycetota bacterium]